MARKQKKSERFQKSCNFEEFNETNSVILKAYYSLLKASDMASDRSLSVPEDFEKWVSFCISGNTDYNLVTIRFGILNKFPDIIVYDTETKEFLAIEIKSHKGSGVSGVQLGMSFPRGKLNVTQDIKKLFSSVSAQDDMIEGNWRNFTGITKRKMIEDVIYNFNNLKELNIFYIEIIYDKKTTSRILGWIFYDGVFLNDEEIYEIPVISEKISKTDEEDAVKLESIGSYNDGFELQSGIRYIFPSIVKNLVGNKGILLGEKYKDLIQNLKNHNDTEIIKEITSGADKEFVYFHLLNPSCLGEIAKPLKIPVLGKKRSIKYNIVYDPKIPEDISTKLGNYFNKKTAIADLIKTQADIEISDTNGDGVIFVDVVIAKAMLEALFGFRDIVLSGIHQMGEEYYIRELSDLIKSVIGKKNIIVTDLAKFIYESNKDDLIRSF